MNKIYLEKLEYNKIIEKLSNYCITYIGKDYAYKLQPSNNKKDVINLLDETNEALSILYKASTPPISEISNITVYLKILESEGTLTLKAILDLANIFKIANELKEYFAQDFIEKNNYPILNTYFSNLYTNESVYKNVFKIVLDENTISDDASCKLKDIRRHQRKIEQNIKSSLNTILHSNSKYIQENIVTLRNDRYVIPVKEEYRSQIKGLIHDISSTGSTVFIEPLAIFEQNNELNNLKIEEKIEIEKIISDLSVKFVPYTKELQDDINTLGILDFLFAKAKYSKELNATRPSINDNKIIKLKNVKHPLLDSALAVPINIEIGEKFCCLIITGPNTGGKTVTLKTVGLISLMACSGLNIPADIGSTICVFDNVFADIGDDQSISESLSTFSSHILNIVDITQNATSNSLILVDELGSGTDPLEGANLAISILEYFKNKNAIIIATTHYQELKKYALSNDGFENASVEFDVDTLSPTYKLLIGVPGKSNAFEISKKLGLDSTIISRAKKLLNSDDVQFETILQYIYDTKLEIEKEKNDISKKLSNIANLEDNLKKENYEKIKKSEQLISNAKQEARKILLDAKEEVNQVLKDINSDTSSKELNNIRNSLNKKISQTNPTITQEPKTNSKYNTIEVKDIKPGLNVFVSNFNQEGIILSNVSKSNEVLVQIGSIKTNVKIENLQKSKMENKSKSTYSYKISKTQNINSEINVIGETVADATVIVDKFLDDCYLAKLQTVRIVHGKGTGKLKNGIHQLLKQNPHVKSFRMGTFGEGEMGVTVVELN